MEEPLGIMIYGYNEEHARAIKESLDGATGRDVMLLSASGRESDKVRTILEAEPDGPFENKDTKVVMFLGFDDGQIDMALKGFPSGGAIARPIFCGLTPDNIGWGLEELLGHLLEERRYWSEKKEGGRP